MPSVPRFRKLVATFLFVCGLQGLALDARGDNLKEAEKLYAAAVKEMAAGKYERACPLFEEAKEKAPEHVRTGMTLAQCYGEWGRPGSAFDELQRMRVLALQQKKLDKVTAIDEQLSTIRKNAPLLLIRVATEAGNQAGLSISRNGKNVPTSSWDTPMPVDPGTYRIEATATGKDPWETSVAVESPGKTITVLVDPPSWKLTTSSSDKGSPSEPAKPPSNKTRTIGFVGLGIGGAALVTGGILGGLAISKQSDGASYCNGQNACTQPGYDLRSTAYLFGNASTALIAVGGALAATGVILVVVGGKNKEDKETAETSILVGPTQIGVVGRW